MTRHAATSCTAVVLLVALCVAESVIAQQPKPDDGFRAHKSLPAATNDGPIRFELESQRKVWGDWETPLANFHARNRTDETINVENGDEGRGFAGKVIYVRDPDGKVRSFGYHWADEKRYPARFHGRTKPFKANESVYTQTVGITPRFGPLKPGTYSVVAAVPTGRFTVNGMPIGRVVSKPWTFAVTSLTPALKKRMLEDPKNPTGLNLTTKQVRNAKGKAVTTVVLTNNSNKSVSYSGYIGDESGLLDREVFGGDGQWQGPQLLWCGTGLITKTVKPGEAATVGTMQVLPHSAAIWRWHMAVNVEGEKTWRKVRSAPIVHRPK